MSQADDIIEESETRIRGMGTKAATETDKLIIVLVDLNEQQKAAIKEAMRVHEAGAAQRAAELLSGIPPLVEAKGFMDTAKDRGIAGTIGAALMGGILVLWQFLQAHNK